VAAAPGAVPVAAGADAAEGAVDGVSSRVTVLVSVPSGWVAVGIGAAWSESYVAAGATAVTPLRDVSGDGFNACCAGVSGSGIRASTRCASGDGDVLSITVATGVTTGTGACSACVPVVDVAGGGVALAGFPPAAMGVQPVAAASTSIANARPSLP
jgi:hypothetical protein